jgi:hypothetical protein
MPDCSREQLLVDLAFELAIVASRNMVDRTKEDVAAWVADHLRDAGFPTAPAGMSWGYLTTAGPAKADPRCRFCGQEHGGLACSLVKSLEYHPDSSGGDLARVEFFSHKKKLGL